MSRWIFWKGPIGVTGTSEEFLFVDHSKEDHNEKDFKRYIIGEILNLQKRSTIKYNGINNGTSENILK